MPAPVSKRRKLEHDSSQDEGDDSASLRSAATSDTESSAGSEAQDADTKQAVKPGKKLNSRRHKTDLTGMKAAQTSLLQMQVAELLQEITPNYASRSSKVSGIIKNVKRAIQKIPPKKPLTLAEAERSLKRDSGISIPFPSPRPPNDAKYKFVYAKPAGLELLGSFDLQTAIRGGDDNPIDLQVTMPTDLFEAKDYLDNRYFYKRAYYLACIAAGLQINKDLAAHVEYALQHESPLQPVLIISAKDAQGSELPPWSKLRILLGPPSNFFRPEKIRPWAPSIRLEEGSDDSDRRSGAAPTPFYNGTMCSDMQGTSYQQIFRSVQKQSQGFQEACRQAKVWLRQRQLGTAPSEGGFGSFEATAIFALMLDVGSKSGVTLLAKDSNGFQIFRALIQLLATRDMVLNPLVLGQDTDEASDLQALGLPVLWDSARGHNLLYKMTTSSFARLRQECQLTLQALAQPAPWRFYPTFIAKCNAVLRFDHIYQIQLPIDIVYDPVELSGIHKSLERGLGDRVREVYVELVPPKVKSHWNLKTTCPSRQTDQLFVCLVVNPENAARHLDLGPSAEEKDAAAGFRAFWGEKAELRRFKDGSILESVPWPKAQDDSQALGAVVEYVIQKSLGQQGSSKLAALGSDFTQLSSGLHMPSAEALSPFKPAEDAFKELEAAIRAASGQPLQVRQISASCANLRYASVYASGKLSVITGEAVMDIIVQYEGSVRWPDDMAAVQRTKVALLFKLGELLEKQDHSFSCTVGLENEHQDLLNVPFLDASCKGHLFRLRIHHDREATLLEKLVKDKSSPHGSRTAAAAALSAHKRAFLLEPRHTQAMAALCVRFPLLSPAMRLLKRWVAAHLLAPHLPEELLELLAAHAFTSPHPYPRPGSLRSAFLRTLALVARWDWRADPLLVNLDPDRPVRAGAAEEAATRLQAWRQLDPAMRRVAVFAASTAEPDGAAFTSPRPSALAAARLAALARAACTAAEAQGLQVDGAPLFAPSLAEFDFVVHLDPKAVSASPRGGFGRPGAAAAFNPVRMFVEELGRVHGECVALFHDFGERPIIGGVWNPQVGAPRDFRIGIGYSAAPVADGDGGEEGQVVINKAGILNEIARLGGDMVASIVRQDGK